MNKLTRKLEKQFPLNMPKQVGNFMVTCVGFGEFKIIPNPHFDDYLFNFEEISRWLKNTKQPPYGLVSANNYYKMHS